VEAWLGARTRGTDVTHLVHAPSNPPGWSAGKWGEWYSDLLDDNGKLSVAKPKPYWQPGWLAQHDQLMAAFAEMCGRIPLVISGDLHDIGIGHITARARSTSRPIRSMLFSRDRSGHHRAVDPRPSAASVPCRQSTSTLRRK
jgi:hypothetical protein